MNKVLSHKVRLGSIVWIGFLIALLQYRSSWLLLSHVSAPSIKEWLLDSGRDESKEPRCPFHSPYIPLSVPCGLLSLQTQLGNLFLLCSPEGKQKHLDGQPPEDVPDHQVCVSFYFLHKAETYQLNMTSES